jgi:hypothetical protein
MHRGEKFKIEQKLIAHRQNTFLNLVLQAQRLALAFRFFPAFWSETTPQGGYVATLNSEQRQELLI